MDDQGLGRRSISPPSPRSSISRHSPLLHEISSNDTKSHEEKEQADGDISEGSTHRRPSKRRPWLRQQFSDGWAGEIVGWTVAAVSIVVIAVLLAIFKDKPVSKWHSRISVNALVNFVSQLGQTALLVPVASSISQLTWIWFNSFRALTDVNHFDKASRQPYDTLMLIWRFPKWPLVYLAALNMILIILVGPFAQQAVSLEPRGAVDDHGVASMPSITNYSYIHTLDVVEFEEDGATNHYLFKSVPGTMKGNILEGLLVQSANLSDIPAACSTGNCTFEPYIDLGICADTEDASDQIVRDCPKNSRNSNANDCTFSVSDLQQHPPIRNENFTNHGIYIGSSTFLNGTSGIGRKQIDASTANNDWREDKGYDLPNPSSLSEFYVLYLSEPGTNVSTKTADSTIRAIKGTIRTCLHLFNTTVMNGQVNTTIKTTYDKELTWQRELNNSAPHFPWEPASPSTKRIFTTLPSDPKKREYSIDGDTRQGISNYLAREVFYGRWDGDAETGLSTATSDAAKSIGRALYGGEGAEKLKFKGTEEVYNQLGYLSTKMMNAMRTTSSHTTTTWGKAWRTEIFIAVSFPWLILPFVTLILSLVQLCITILRSRKLGIPAWKAGPLHLLTALEPGLRGASRADKDGAAEVMGRLAPDQRGEWALYGKDRLGDGRDS